MRECSCFLQQGTYAHDDGIGVSTEQLHEPAILLGAGDISARRVLAFKGGYAVNGLHKVRKCPGPLRMRCRKSQIAVWSISGIGEDGRLGVIEKNFEITHVLDTTPLPECVR